MGSRFDEFKHRAENIGVTSYKLEIQGNGSFDYNTQVSSLIELENKLNLSLLNYLFSTKESTRLGEYIADKFVRVNRNLLKFLDSIDSEMKFFILYELKTNKELFAHCK